MTLGLITRQRFPTPRCSLSFCSEQRLTTHFTFGLPLRYMVAARGTLCRLVFHQFPTAFCADSSGRRMQAVGT